MVNPTLAKLTNVLIDTKITYSSIDILNYEGAWQSLADLDKHPIYRLRLPQKYESISIGKSPNLTLDYV